MSPCPALKPRRPYDDETPLGYLESDKDFVLNNLEACVWFLQDRGMDDTLKNSSGTT